MQFKHPELLWGLFLLLIPVIIHLFQLRRFEKTPFTNVKFLKQVVAESRRSNILKKWLLLCTRLILLAALILAFAQPFFADQYALRQKETVIYLDNSFSVQAKSANTTMLEDAIQALIKSIPKNQSFSLFTNEKVFNQISLPEAQNDLLDIESTSEQLQLNQIYLKANTLFTKDPETAKNLVLVSDFQARMASSNIDTVPGTVKKYLVPLSKGDIENVALDSLYLDGQNSDNIELTAIVSRTGSIEGTPVSLFNGERLIAKTAAVFEENNQTKVQFSLPKNEKLDGKLEVSDSGLNYDNRLYFNIDSKEKIKVLVIGNVADDYLEKIYNVAEFNLTTTSLDQLNYGDLDIQNLIILNELPSIPPALTTRLRSFTDNGGSLTIVPSGEIDLNSYNLLISNYFSSSLKETVYAERSVTNISFSHPLFRNVFEKNVTNFQFPKVSQHFGVKTTAAWALAFQNNTPFLIGREGFYLFTASITLENSNFKNSPLIVPTFYNMGNNSLKLPPLYGVLGNDVSIDVSASLSDDTILKVKKGDYEFIPRQQAYANKVTLTFDENLKEDGIYTISQNDEPLQRISFNYDRGESELNYMDLNDLSALSQSPSIASLFDSLEKDNRITVLWKWFVILALLMMAAEILIQKFLA
ncbi:BatA domain-containing protein [Pricia sp. S334]|uniref:BatA domain-containing protein n=1 Tax=Pricia mediterranea TaxID=3076079 RepID=A0ABU3KZZ1_9FLAO|nr:BatA domain-containing protein [Pricia sp. S334]MDT7827047.1 BatA domain-containing protein [Pricia sp. S334]